MKDDSSSGEVSQSEAPSERHLQPNVGRTYLQHPAQHLADALSLNRRAEQEAGRDLNVLTRRGADNARAAGEALAFLLHPVAAQLPRSLTDRAFKVLSKCAALLGEYRNAATVSSASGDGSSLLSKKVAAWERRGEKTPSFKKLLALTGLAPVKQALANLADKARKCLRN